MNAHVISPSLKDFVRYQVGSEMSLLRKVLPWLCPFSASSTSEQEWELQALLPLGFLQEAALCTPGCSILQGFLYLGGVWCWELSHTGTAWAFQLETAHPELLALVPHHLLGNKPVFHWGMVWNRVTQKNPAWSTQLCPNLHCTQQKHHIPFQQKAWRLFWVTCRVRLVWELKLLIKTILEPWAAEHFGSFATVGLFPLTSDEISNSWWAALGFPVLQLCSVL